MKRLIRSLFSGRVQMGRRLFDAEEPFYTSPEGRRERQEEAVAAPRRKDLPDPVQGRRRRAALEDGEELELIPVPAGEYTRGSRRWFAGEKPPHRVLITHSFWMAQYQVTQDAFQQVIGENPSHFGGASRPVEMVTWYEAMRFCSRLTASERESGLLPEGYEYRLPTEGEWEYAARGGSDGDGYKYSGGNDIGAVAWHGGGMGGNSDHRTHPVGQRAPNRLGLYDMSGNVWEWCHDWHEDYPKVAGVVDPTGPQEGSHRVLRGGSWAYEPTYCRVTRRDGLTPGHRYFDLGFRMVLGPCLELLRAWSRKIWR